MPSWKKHMIGYIPEILSKDANLTSCLAVADSGPGGDIKIPGPESAGKRWKYGSMNFPMGIQNKEIDMAKNIKVPTGNILIIDGQKGKLECLSLGDYSRDKNVKASFLGLEKEIEGVPNGDIMPLSEKWVVTISTQYGCSMGCKFCDVPKVGHGLNATETDLTSQIMAAINLHPEITSTKRLNIHYARMGEPTFNRNVLSVSYKLHWLTYNRLSNSMIHPVVSTMLPNKNKKLMRFLQDWCEIKNYVFRGDAGLQFSINSTDDYQREYLFSGSSLSLSEISEVGKGLPYPKGRKYALNFAISDGNEVDAERLLKLFNPKKFMVKITPIHITTATIKNGIETTGGYTEYTPYQKIEIDLKTAGFDVLVFVPSLDEDKGRITCGNAILSGSIPDCKHSVSELCQGFEIEHGIYSGCKQLKDCPICEGK